MTERETILHAAAEAVAAEWLADEIRAARFDTKPNSYRIFNSATNVLARFYDRNLDHGERNEIIFERAPKLLDVMRQEHQEHA